MRQWHVDPKLLCRSHLLGEHVEHHMFLGTIERGVSLQGYVDNGLIEIATLQSRHDELAAEMGRRGYNHKSPLYAKGLLSTDVHGEPWPKGHVDREDNLAELKVRCQACSFRQEGIEN